MASELGHMPLYSLHGVIEEMFICDNSAAMDIFLWV